MPRMAEIVRLKSVEQSAAKEIDALLKQLDKGKSFSLQSLEALVQSPSSELWVAKEGNAIVGMATLNFLQRVMGLVGYVDDVVVDAQHRGKGFGTKLLEAVIESARARGAGELALTSRPSREEANKLYQKLGFKLKETNSYRMKL